MNTLLRKSPGGVVPFLFGRGSGLLGRLGHGQGVHTTPTPLSMVKGQVALTSPKKVMCQAGQTYSWCACGLSGKQPFCDGSHKNSTLGITPIKWKADASKEYLFCGCKQTENRPMCDGSHKKLP